LIFCFLFLKAKSKDKWVTNGSLMGRQMGLQMGH
jgi:hypothetical protein